MPSIILKNVEPKEILAFMTTFRSSMSAYHTDKKMRLTLTAEVSDRHREMAENIKKMKEPKLTVKCV